MNAEIYLINEPANLRIHKFKAAKKNDHIFCAVTHTHMYHKCYYMLAFESKKHTNKILAALAQKLFEICLASAHFRQVEKSVNESVSM